ncbi:MAG: glycosyltransferase family 39 protein [Candidatus Spechtbacterales bacterium]
MLNALQRPLVMRLSLAIAAVLLLVMGGLLLFRAYHDAAIYDETAHIISGYATVVGRDYRINPEHPPLVKMASAIPLALQNFNDPLDRADFDEKLGTDSQWTLGNAIIYEVENDATALTFWSRVGPVLLALFLGAFIFIWARRLYGWAAALLALALFVFSPTFLAHGAYVTTDVGATLAFFFATYFLFRYLRNESAVNLAVAGVAFGLAQSIKFSLILLIPYFAAIVVAWVLFKNRPINLLSFRTLGRIGAYFGKLIVIGLIGLAVVYPIYLYAIWDYPAEEQIEQTSQILANSPFRIQGNQYGETGQLRPLGIEVSSPGVVLWMAHQEVLRPYAQFFMGHLMVFQRVSGGNTTYFMGEVSADGWLEYFPIVFAVKVPLALLALMALGSAVAVIAFVRGTRLGLRGYSAFSTRVKAFLRMVDGWVQEYFWELMFALFIVLYWTASILGNLNIGVRHILPTFPFLYLLLAAIIVRWVRFGTVRRSLNVVAVVRSFARLMFMRWVKISVVLVLLIWYMLSSLSYYPHSLAYYNELARLAGGGEEIAVDSNLDWGQDIRGLARFVDERDIEEIRVSYFGPWGAPGYYLGNRALPLDWYNEEHRSGWIAVSATFLQGGRAESDPSFNESTTHFIWLDAYKPEEIIGHSIYVFYIPE